MTSIEYSLNDLDSVDCLGLANLFLDSIRKKEAIIVQYSNKHYNYRFQSKTKDNIEKWVCMTDGCSCTISLLNEKVVKINGTKVYHNTPLPPHNHRGDIDTCTLTESEYKKKLIESELKDKAGKSGAAPIKAMFEDKASQLRKDGMSINEIASVMSQYNSFKNTMYRAKHENYPLIPHKLEDLNFWSDISKVFTECTGSVVNGVKIPGKRFLLFDDMQEIYEKKNGKLVLKTKERITIFCSEVGLRLLANAEKIGADGTFKSRPILNEQVYIIMVWMNGEKGSVCLPAAFVLLGGKHSKFKILYLFLITFIKKYFNI